MQTIAAIRESKASKFKQQYQHKNPGRKPWVFDQSSNGLGDGAAIGARNGHAYHLREQAGTPPVRSHILENVRHFTLDAVPDIMLDPTGALAHQPVSTAEKFNILPALADRPIKCKRVSLLKIARAKALRGQILGRKTWKSGKSTFFSAATGP